MVPEDYEWLVMQGIVCENCLLYTGEQTGYPIKCKECEEND